MNNAENSNKKGRFWKKTVYRVQSRSWKKVIAMALVIGILAGIVYGVVDVYENYATSYAQISFVYPQIADGKYPDGSRFTTYDMLSEERVAEALSAMQAKGKYENYTVDQLLEQFDVHTYTEGSVAEDVSSLRSEGNNYSYFANEYRITFSQPHDYKAANFKDRLMAVDHSAEFLEELMQAELRWVSKYYGGANGFSEMTVMEALGSQDYNERVMSYRNRISIILRYLNYLNANSSGFVSKTTGKDLMDLISHYEVLRGERLNQIENFILTSGVTTDLTTLLNKLNVRKEEYELKSSNLKDAVEINRFAMNSYDHTFSENLIVVSTSNQAGLYQARPKTAFDSVVNQFNNAVNNAIEAEAKLNTIAREVELFTSVSRQTMSYTRLISKCEELLDKFISDYTELSQTAIETMNDYLAQSNEEYISYKVVTQKLFTRDLLTKSAFIAAAVAVLVFILAVVGVAVSDFSRMRRKKRMLKRMSSYREKLDAVD